MLIIISLWQALDQCEMTISKLNVARVSVDNTAEAAQVICATFSGSMIFVFSGSSFMWLHMFLLIESSEQTVASSGMSETGAIASPRAAKIYGLNILAENIQVKSYYSG